MCTLSWSAREAGSGYYLLFNRDEQRDREEATNPALDHSGLRSFVAARDGRAGGTWLLANDRGVSIAILNHYAADINAPTIRKPESRGALVVSMAECDSTAGFRKRMTDLQPADRYRPFMLFSIDPELETSLWRWDGEQYGEVPVPDPAMISTSSFESAAVISHRLKLRAALGERPTFDQLRNLHEQHDDALPAHSIRMRRDDAKTVSLCELEITEHDACYRYRAEPESGLKFLEASETRLAFAKTQ